MGLTRTTQPQQRRSIFARDRSLRAEEADAIEQINAIFHKEVTMKADALRKGGIMNPKNGSVAARVRRNSIGFLDLVKRSFSTPANDHESDEEEEDEEAEEDKEEEQETVLLHGTRLPSAEGRIFSAIYEYEGRLVHRFIARVYGYEDSQGNPEPQKVVRMLSKRALQMALERLLPHENFGRFAQFPFYGHPKNTYLTDSQLEAALANVLKFTMVTLPGGRERAWESDEKRRTEEEKIHTITMIALHLFRPYQQPRFRRGACKNLIEFCLGTSLLELSPTIDLYKDLEKFMRREHALEVFRFFVGVQKLEQMMTPPAENADQHVTNLQAGLDFCDFASKLYQKSFPDDTEKVALTLSSTKREELEATIVSLEDLFYAEESNLNWGRDLYKMMNTIMKAFRACRDENLPTLNDCYLRYVRAKRRKIWRAYKESHVEGKEYSCLQGIILEHKFMQAALYKLVEQMDRIMLFARTLVPEPTQGETEARQRGQGDDDQEDGEEKIDDDDWEGYDESSSDESDLSQPSRL